MPTHIYKGIKLVLILLALLIGFPEQSNAQVSISSSTPVVKSCLSTDTVRVIIKNTGSSTLDSIHYTPDFPDDVTYDSGSVVNAQELNVSNLNKPVFTINSSLASGDSVIVKYVLEGGCDLDDQNKFPYIKHEVDRYTSGSSSSSSLNDTLATFITPDLAIANITVSGSSAYTYVGDTVELVIKLTNNSFADVISIAPELTLGNGLQIVSSDVGSVSQSGTKATIVVDSTIESKTDFTFKVKLRVTSCKGLDAFISIYWGCKNTKCNTETSNYGAVKTVPSNALSVKPKILSPKIINSPFCSNDTMWSSYSNVTSEPYVAGSGTIYDINLKFRLDNFRAYHDNGVSDSLEMIIGDTSLWLTANHYRPGRSLTNLFTWDVDGPGGLSDVDGDGYYDDLASGDSLMIGVILLELAQCKGLAGLSTISGQEKINLGIEGRNGCNSNQFAKNGETSFQLHSQNFSNSGKGSNQFHNQTNIDTATPLSLRYTFTQDLPPNCGPGSKVRTYFMLPGDLSVQNFKVATASSNGYSTHYQGDTLVLEQYSNCTDTTKVCTMKSVVITFDLHMDCNTKTRSLRLEYITTVQCDTACNSCEYVTRRGYMPVVYLQPCASSGWCAGPTLTHFDINRISLGYDSIYPNRKIDSTNAKTKVFLSYDTLLLEANGILSSTNWDSLRFTYEHTPLRTSAGVKYFDQIKSELFVYSSTGSFKGSCDQFAVLDSMTSSGHVYGWNLSNHGCSSYPSLAAGDSLVFKAYLVCDTVPYYGGYDNVLGQNLGYFSVDSSGSNQVCNYLGAPNLEFHNRKVNMTIDKTIGCTIWGGYNPSGGYLRCSSDVIILSGYMPDLLNQFPFSNEYRPFFKFKTVKYVPSKLTTPTDSFLVSANYGFWGTPNLSDHTFDTIYHTRSGDTLIYDFSDTSLLPYGYNSCSRNLFALFLPVHMDCDNASGHYVNHTFIVDYDLNVGDDSSRLVQIRNKKVSINQYYQLPDPAVTHNVDYVDAVSDTNFWELRLKNNNKNTRSDYQTLFFIDSFGQRDDIEILRVEINGKSFYPSREDSVTVRVDLDTFEGGQDKAAKIYFKTTSCRLDTICYDFALGCSRLERKSIDNICQRKRGQLYVDPKPINPRIQIIEEPSSSTVDLCETMHYEVELTNSQVANGSNVRFYFLPPSGNGFTVLGDSCYFYYASDTNTQYALGVPLYDSANDRYQWDLASDHILGGVNSSKPDFIFHIAVAPNCNFNQNDFVRFQSSAIAPCQDSVASNITTGQNIVLNNISNISTSHFSRSTITPVQTNLCDTMVIRYTWVNIGNDLSGSNGHTDPDTTTAADFMEIQIPSGISNSPFEITPNTTNGASLSISDSTDHSGITRLKIQLPSGLDKTDSLSIDLSFVPNHLQNCTHSFTTSITNYFVFESYCGALNDTCRLQKETGYEQSTNITFDSKWTFDVLNLGLNLIPDSNQDVAVTQLQLVSKGTLLESKPLILNYYFDSNNNGVIDAGDSLVSQSSHAQLLQNGDTLNLTDTTTISAGWSCNLLMAINADSNCICSDFDTAFPSPNLLDLTYTDSICYSASGMITIGQKVNNHYRYRWTTSSGAFTFEDTLEQPTITYTLTNPAADSSYWFIRNIDLNTNGCSDSDSVLVLVKRTPEVELGPDTHLCVLDTFTFSIEPYNYSVIWQDGSTDSFYKAYDDEKVWVTVSNSCGSASDTLNYFVEELAILTIPFYTDSIQCRSNNFFILGSNINNLSNNSITYLWDWKDGDSTVQNPASHGYSTALSDSVRLVAYNGWCYDSMSTPIVVLDNPTASFKIDKLDTCSGTDSFRFVVTSSIVSSFVYSWTFGDGSTIAYGDTVYKSYSDTGNFDVKLKVQLPGRCADSILKTVRVYPTPIVQFSITDSLQCLRNNTFEFQNTSTLSSGSLGFSWRFGDGTNSADSSPIKVYSTHGTFTVQLSTTSPFGCSDSTSDSIVVYQQPTAGFTLSKVDTCLIQNQFDFTNTSSIVSDSLLYTWSFGDGNTGTDTSYTGYSYKSDSAYTVQLITFTSNGCSDTTRRLLSVYPDPMAKFSIDDSLQCLRSNAFTLTNSSQITSGNQDFLWSFGDGTTSSDTSPTITYSTHGIYHVKLITTSGFGCSDSLVDSVEVYQQPVARFTVNKTDSCLNTNQFDFNNTSSIASDSLLYAWNLGDGTIGTDTNWLDYTYTDTGSYTIQLTTVTPFGCADTSSTTIGVYPNPLSSFSIQDSLQCLNGNNFIFTNASTITKGTLTHLWTLGDGSTTNQASNTKSYTTAGVYVVKLISTSNYFCTDSIVDSVEVYQQPTAQFNVVKTDSCLRNNAFDFVNTSFITSDSLLYTWDFGDGNSGTDTSYYGYSYANDGLYRVQLAVNTLNGCADTTTDSLQIYPTPIAGFTIDDSLQCLRGNLFTFTDTSSLNSGTMNALWNFGDGSTSTTSIPTKTYAADGTYQIQLKLTSGAFCMASITDSVRVYAQPYAHFNVVTTDSCLRSNTYDFINTSSISSGTMAYQWTLGDGNSGTDSNYLDYSYSTSGNFSIQLIATTPFGCADTTSQNTVVYPMPTASVVVNDSIQCLTGNNFTFVNNSSIPSGTLTHYYDFGNSTISTNSTPNISYPTTGNYQILYVATSAHYCSDSQSINTYVLDVPTVDFTIDSLEVCLPTNEFNFNNNSSIANGTLTYQWSLSDGYTTTNDSILSYQFASVGSYAIKLLATASNSLGCADSITKNVRILTQPSADFSINDTSQCFGSQLFVFTNTGTSSANYFWTFGDGTNNTTENSNKTYPTTGNYEVKLVTSLHGRCKDSTTKTVHVIPVPSAVFTVNDLTQCFTGHQFDFALNGPLFGSNNILWDFGDGNSATDSAVLGYTYNAPGTYAVKAKVSSGTCADSTTQNVVVYDDPVASFSGDSVCLGDLVQFTNNSTITNGSIVSYAWDFGDNSAGISASPSYQYKNEGYFTVILKATSNQGCVGSDTLRAVRIYPKPTASMVANFLELGSGGQMVRYTSTSTNADNYTWHFDDQTSATGIEAEKTYAFTGRYSTLLIASNDFGCLDSTRLDTNVVVPQVLFIPTAFSPNQDGINDLFGVNLRGTPIAYKMSIFNRWGELLYTTDNPTNTWDGTYLDTTVQNGTYVYIIFVKTPGDVHTYSGSVQVLR